MASTSTSSTSSLNWWFAFKKINITPLAAPGPELKYLDRAFAVKIFLEAASLNYLLTEVKLKDHPPTWNSDTKAVIALLVQVVSEATYQAIRKHQGDALGMWKAFKATHQDHTPGGRINWLCKLLLSRMNVSDKLPTHIKKMQGIYRHSPSLISDKHSLQPGNIFAAFLVISLPIELLPVGLLLMSDPVTSSNEIVHEHNQDDTFAKNPCEVETTKAAVSWAKTKNQNLSKSKSIQQQFKATL